MRVQEEIKLKPYPANVPAGNSLLILTKKLFFMAISFLIIRNLPLCIFLPPWSFGDEMAHFDYILKLKKGHIPHPQDYIEEDLFLFHKNNFDYRYIIPKEQLQLPQPAPKQPPKKQRQQSTSPKQSPPRDQQLPPPKQRQQHSQPPQQQQLLPPSRGSSSPLPLPSSSPHPLSPFPPQQQPSPQPPTPPPILSLRDLGFAAFSYQAKHPPLAYIIYFLASNLLAPLHLSLGSQLILFRIIALLAVVIGLILIYSGLTQNQLDQPVFYLPLILVPLLAQDMYFSLNIDVFTFLFGGLVINRMFYLWKEPRAKKNWFFLSVAVILTLWVKATGLLILGVFGLFVIYLVFRYRHHPSLSKNIFLNGSLFLPLTLILSSPWYIFNLIRLDNLVVINNNLQVGLPQYPAKAISWANIVEFVQAFTRTIFRGEFIWHGHYFDVLPLWANDIFLTVIPLGFFILGISYLFLPKQAGEENGSTTFWQKFFLLAGVSVIAVLLFGYFFIGEIPYYQARMAFCCLYFVTFVFSAGWLKVFKPSKFSILLFPIILLAYNLFVMFKLISEVIYHI